MTWFRVFFLFVFVSVGMPAWTEPMDGFEVCDFEFVAEPKNATTPDFIMDLYADDFFRFFYAYLQDGNGVLTDKALSYRFMSISFSTGSDFKEMMSISVAADREDGRSYAHDLIDEVAREMLWDDYEFDVLAEPLECRYLECDDAYCDGYSLYWN